MSLTARQRRRQGRKGLGHRLATTPSGRRIDEIGEAHKQGERAATRQWVGMSPHRPQHAALERGVATVALDLWHSDQHEASLALLGMRYHNPYDDDEASASAHRRGFDMQLFDYLKHAARREA